MSDPREQELDRLCGVLARVDEEYDDVGRARAEARLRQALGARSRRPSAALAGAAALAVAIAATLVIARPWRLPKNVPTAAAPALVLRPYVVAPSIGGTAAFVQGIADGPSLDVPAGWLVRARLNDNITVGAVGPTRLTVSGTESAPQLRLERGRVLVEVTPGRGTRLRVTTARFDVAVVGTLFSVDASEVNVRHGRVRVNAGGAVSEVDGGRRWRASAGSLEPLDAEAARALDAHAAASSPPAETVAVGVVGEPAGAEIWQGNRRVAVTPASLRLAAGTELHLTAPGRTGATFVVPATRTTIAYNLAAEGTKGSVVPRVRADEGQAHGQTAAPTAHAPPPPQAPTQQRPTARELYRDADRALTAGDRERASAALLAVLRVGGDDVLMDAARIDLATLAMQAGELDAARRYLDGAHVDAVAEPAARMRCRLAMAGREDAAADCFAAFRARFPSSPHDAEALVDEAVLRADHDECARALPLLEEASSRGLPADLRDAVRARRARCRTPR